MGWKLAIMFGEKDPTGKKYPADEENPTVRNVGRSFLFCTWKIYSGEKSRLEEFTSNQKYFFFILATFRPQLIQRSGGKSAAIHIFLHHTWKRSNGKNVALTALPLNFLPARASLPLVAPSISSNSTKISPTPTTSLPSSGRGTSTLLWYGGRGKGGGE